MRVVRARAGYFAAQMVLLGTSTDLKRRVGTLTVAASPGLETAFGAHKRGKQANIAGSFIYKAKTAKDTVIFEAVPMA